MMKKPNLGTRISNFFTMNWWFTGVSNIIIIFLIAYTLSELEFVRNDFTKKLDNSIKNVAIATPDGRIALIKRELIDSDTEYFTNHLKSIVKKMNTSESILTHGFNKSVVNKIVSYESLGLTDENFKLLGKEFFDNKEIYDLFLRFYYNLLKTGELPKKIQIFKTTPDFKPLEGNTFEMTVKFDTQKDFVNKINSTSTELVAEDKIVVYGYISPSEHSSADNPFGVRITDFKIGLYLYSNYIKGE